MIAKLVRARALLLASLVVAGAGIAGIASGQQYGQPAPQPAQAQQGQQRVEAAPNQQPRQRGFVEPGYIGRSLLQIPDVAGNWRGSDHRGWVSIDAHYWRREDNNFGRLLRQQVVAAAPGAPASGEGRLYLAIDKNNPALPALMERCRSHVTMPEVGYSVSAARSQVRVGGVANPGAALPETFEYRLRNVQFVDCPVVDGAPEQAIVVQFGDIGWLNFDGSTVSVPVSLEARELAPLPRNLTGETRSWVLTWFALANDIADDQCPVMNLKPTEDDYYRLVPPEEATRERAELESVGGVNYDNGQMGLRGPSRINVTLLPGVVADPGQHEPNTRVARGLNLDGDSSGRRHRNYVSQDGALTGIDNQLYTSIGCNAGWQGHHGFMFQYNMEAMRNGQISILVQVDGIDNAQNDREIYVTTMFSLDDMAKNGAGSAILPDYTFRASNDPQYAHYFTRARGRIVDGVILTEPVDDFRLNVGRLASPRPPRVGMQDARMRLELHPDGTLHGVVAGYVDWRELITNQGTSSAEFSQGFQMPAVYNALRRNADGLRDPVTGQYNGISAAYDMDGVPAFVTSAMPNVASVDRPSGGS